jgi:hypothetical protein
VNPSTPKLAGRRKEGEEGGIHPGLRNRVCNLYTTKGKVRNLMYEFFHFGPATTSVVKPREREEPAYVQKPKIGDSINNSPIGLEESPPFCGV